jgi:hypothetical protein
MILDVILVNSNPNCFKPKPITKATASGWKEPVLTPTPHGGSAFSTGFEEYKILLNYHQKHK